MNKKLIVLILTVFMLLTTVIISIFGKQPDPPTVHVEKIEFSAGEGEKFEYNEEEVLVVILDINDIEKTGNKYIVEYQLNYIITPDDSVNKIIYFNVENSSFKEFVTITSTGLMTIEFDEDEITGLDIAVIAKSADDASNATAKMILRLEYTGTGNPW